ncbi:CARDB domain-containing protein [Balamuthia mandrillaris]
MESNTPSFFWNGILTVDDNGSHSFFAIKLTKDLSSSPPKVSLFTSDLPPVPVTKETTLRATFLLENNVGVTTVRYKIAEATLFGSSLEGKNAAISSDGILTVKTEMAEWRFLKQQNWLLQDLNVRVPPEQLQKFISLI